MDRPEPKGRSKEDVQLFAILCTEDNTSKILNEMTMYEEIRNNDDILEGYCINFRNQSNPSGVSIAAPGFIVIIRALLKGTGRIVGENLHLNENVIIPMYKRNLLGNTDPVTVIGEDPDATIYY